MAIRRHGLYARGLACLSLIITTLPVRGQTPDERLPLFLDEAPLQFTLEAPLRELGRTSRSREELDGLVRYADASGTPVTLEVEVRVRGNSRLIQCDFPPLRLDFKRGQLEGTVFEGQNRLKLVTLCKRQTKYRDYLALEYDIYRLFGVLSDRSFRVRRATVEYVTTDSRRPASFTEPAFFIEEDWEVAARHGAQVIERDRLQVSELDPEHTALLGVFQYMIGNTDWSIVRGPDGGVCCHNGKVIGLPQGGLFILPYDFDQAGLIDTEYSMPAESLRIRSVTQRLYRGACEFNGNLEHVFAAIGTRRTALEAVFDDTLAGDRAKEDALEYLQESLEILEDSAERTEEILEACRG